MEHLHLPHHHQEGPELEVIKSHLAQAEYFQPAADAFKQLSDSTRIRIFWLLCHYEECVINISSMMDMSSPAISHHLRALKSSGLITSRRDGKEVYYRSADTAESQLLHNVIEQVMQIQCPK